MIYIRCTPGSSKGVLYSVRSLRTSFPNYVVSWGFSVFQDDVVTGIGMSMLSFDDACEAEREAVESILLSIPADVLNNIYSVKWAPR